jgi:hypothetical protein
MRNNRLGCFTSYGILSTLVTVFAITGIAFTRGGLMYNPGPLNAQSGRMLGGVTSHAETGGECEVCHSAPWSSVTMADLCVDCHGDIALQMQDMVALHGAMYQKEPGLECRDCHPEHRGANAPLTALHGREFPHELMGFSLNGHRLKVWNEPFTCADCHQEDITTFATDSCDACHRQMDAVFAQAHFLSFGATCLDCHDGIDRFGRQFNHNVSQFKLAGEHVNVACVQCHTGTRNFSDFRTTPDDCYSCHRTDDPHEMRFGTECSLCHTTDGWESATFDHNLAAFKLEGAHAEVACEECHQNSVFIGAPMNCYACHQDDDEHEGRFGRDCSVCHVTANWDEVTFDHNRSSFPLDGAHVNVVCEDCHISGQFTGLSTECIACHADPDFHVGAFGASCADCHTTTTWLPASVNLSHPEPRVDEEGTGINHGYTTCRTCHPSTVRSYTCLACHSDNQGGEDGEGREEEDEHD